MVSSTLWLLVVVLHELLRLAFLSWQDGLIGHFLPSKASIFVKARRAYWPLFVIDGQSYPFFGRSADTEDLQMLTLDFGIIHEVLDFRIL